MVKKITVIALSENPAMVYRKQYYKCNIKKSTMKVGTKVVVKMSDSVACTHTHAHAHTQRKTMLHIYLNITVHNTLKFHKKKKKEVKNCNEDDSHSSKLATEIWNINRNKSQLMQYW
jgi:hypothetical protein